MKHTLIQLLAAAGALILAIGAYGLWFVVVDTASANARALAGEIAVKGKDAERIAEAKMALAALAVNEDAIATHYVSANDIVPFLSSLQATGKALGATVDVVSVGADATPGKVGHLNLSVHITGPFDSVIRTLGAFEYAPYDIVLTNLTLDTTGSSLWSAAVNLNVGTGVVASSTPKKP